MYNTLEKHLYTEQVNLGGLFSKVPSREPNEKFKWESSLSKFVNHDHSQLKYLFYFSQLSYP